MAARVYTRYGVAELSPLERQIRDLLHATQALQINTPGEVDNARQLAQELRDYATQAMAVGFPYTCKMLLQRRDEIELRLQLMHEISQAIEPTVAG
jgi:hypothetical protein